MLHRKSRKSVGFTLVELLLVLSILGIISAIAIPSFLGQRRRARVIGDAQANARVLAMALEARKAENGTYGPAATYTWTSDGPQGEAGTFLPSFQPRGNTRMELELAITNIGLTYTLTVRDPQAANRVAYQTNERGEQLQIMN